MLKALLFDLDGTLAETDSLHLLGWMELFKPHGYEVDQAFFQEHMSGRVYPEVVRNLLPDLPPEEARAMVEAKEADFLGRTKVLEPLSGLLDFIAAGRKRGVEIALVTNATKEATLAVLRALDLEEMFDPVILADEVGAVKPDPALYRAALETLGVSAEEAVAFEDSPLGIASSIAAGVPTVGVASTHAPRKLAALGVELVVADFADPRLTPLLDG